LITKKASSDSSKFDDVPVIDAIMASGALPPIFNPVKLNGHLYTDGGYGFNMPISNNCNSAANNRDKYTENVARHKKKLSKLRKRRRLLSLVTVVAIVAIVKLGLIAGGPLTWGLLAAAFVILRLACTLSLYCSMSGSLTPTDVFSENDKESNDKESNDKESNDKELVLDFSEKPRGHFLNFMRFFATMMINTKGKVPYLSHKARYNNRNKLTTNGNVKYVEIPTSLGSTDFKKALTNRGDLGESCVKALNG
jgi:hypothetical protein